MHKSSPRLHWVAAAQLGALCALCCGLLTSTHAEPLVLHDGTSHADTTAYTLEPVIQESEASPVGEVPVSPAAIGSMPTKPESAASSERTPPPATLVMPERPSSAPTAAQGKTQSDADLSIHGVIKENVRPVYEQLVESGAVEALHDLKVDLGLNNNQWNNQEKTNATGETSRRWDTPSGQNSPQPAKTAAQVQLDREMAGMMREKLIDQITPWLIGAVVLYAVAYLAKLLHRYMRWRSDKRNRRRSARSQRQASRGTRSSPRATTQSPTAPQPTVESQDTA